MTFDGLDGRREAGLGLRGSLRLLRGERRRRKDKTQCGGEARR
jgi:hypothetical protein